MPLLALLSYLALAAPGLLLEELTWPEAEKVLTPDTIVVLPLGAAAKEHGPHLKLKNDFLIAEYLKERVLEKATVVVAPTLNYHFYPAFVEYPGSTTFTQDTARNVVVEICRSLAAYGPRRFYVLNTGISTVRALRPAAEELAKDGLLLAYTDLHCLDEVEKSLARQPYGSHADELETSLMLYIAPATVDMTRAVRDCNPDRPGGLTRRPEGPGTYSPTGVWGDATLATWEKGQIVCEALVAAVLADLEKLRRQPLP